ncbi:MAG: DHH family phosphoesterase [Bacteroidaceae bacterium]|nr:DHH family phosphoesterase [Bacteroidaceae bacterium]
MITNKISVGELEAVKKLFDDCHNVVIVTHTSADGDAIGSALGLYEYLKKRGKSVKVVVPNYFPDFLRWMTDADKIISYNIHRKMAQTYVDYADLICVLDLNEPKRMEDLGDVVVKARAKKVMIDHHLNPDCFCDVTVSYPSASSASELVFRIIYGIGGLAHLTRAGAEDIYAGMCTDTGKFSFNSNDPDIFLIIAELLKKGIDKDKIVRNIYNNFTEGRFKLLGYVLYEKLKVVADKHAAYFSLTKDELSRFNYIKGDMEGVVNMPLEIKGVRMSISLREDTEKPRILVSVRSVDDFPANKVAEVFFNGGGHLNAAGGMLYCSMAEAIEITEKAINYKP